MAGEVAALKDLPITRMNMFDLPPHMVKKLVPVTEAGCWIWMASCSSGGYGMVSHNGKPAGAHRVAYELLVGPIPDGLDIDHLCRVRCCCNPAHMEPVTRRVNLLRAESLAAINARKTHCPKGHAYEGNNLRTLPNGERKCKICSHETLQRFKANNPTYVRDKGREQRGKKKLKSVEP